MNDGGVPQSERIERLRYGEPQHEPVRDGERGREVSENYGDPQHERGEFDPKAADRAGHEDRHWPCDERDCGRRLGAGQEPTTPAVG